MLGNVLSYGVDDYRVISVTTPEDLEKGIMGLLDNQPMVLFAMSSWRTDSDANPEIPDKNKMLKRWWTACVK